MSELAKPPGRVRVVSATRMEPSRFGSESALGRSLARLSYDGRLKATIAFGNRMGLPLIYNTVIAQAEADEQLVFLHDDVWLDDYHFCDRVLEGLQAFDVIGVAGNRRRLPNQPSWLYLGVPGPRDAEPYTSGIVAHGREPAGEISCFGPVGVACELLDGVLLAARAGTLRQAGVGFDPRFEFHFYDLDFCRTARQQGLRLGTWPIAITHQSEGSFYDPQWLASARSYFDKWSD